MQVSNVHVFQIPSSGLSHSEAAKLDNFFHFSKPKNLKKKSILELGDLNPAMDFFDVLSEDIPKGEITELSLCKTYLCHLFYKNEYQLYFCRYVTTWTELYFFFIVF